MTETTTEQRPFDSLELRAMMDTPRERIEWHTLFAPKDESERRLALERVAQAYVLLRHANHGERRKLLANRAVAQAVAEKVKAFNELKRAGVIDAGDAKRSAKARAKAGAATKDAPASPAAVADARRLTLLAGEYRDFLRLALGRDDLPADADKVDARFVGALLAERQGASNSRPARPARFPTMVALLTIEHLIAQRFLPIDGEADASFDSEMHLAAGLMDFYASSTDTREQLKNELAGHFYTYRRSWHWPGSYVKGALRVRPVPITLANGVGKGYALCTTERHIHHGQDGSAPVQETYVGVMSRKQGHAFILSSVSSPDRIKRGAPRFTLFHTSVHESISTGDGMSVSRVGSMTGTTVALVERGQSYAAKVCIERAPGTGQPPIDALGVFERDDKDAEGRFRIPRSVIARLDDV
jgi:hypothetical protein